MKKNRLTTIIIVMLLIAMILLIMVSGTYAKYVTSVSGADTATVAKFSVGGITSTSFDLFNTALTEASSSDTETDVNTSTIAPGTGGSFGITLTNDSDVSVDYVLSLEETNTSGIPIEYSVDGTTYVTYDNLASQTNSQGKLEVGSTTTQTKAITIYWRWAFIADESSNYQSTQSDTNDTALGMTAATGTAPTVTVTATATFTQHD